MTLKNPKPSQTNKNLLKNFDLVEELKDKNGEKISGGGIFSFVNMTQQDIEIDLLNVITNGIIIEQFIVEPFNIAGTQIANIPGQNQINVRYLPNLEVDPIEDIMASNQTGIFDEEDNAIVFYLE